MSKEFVFNSVVMINKDAGYLYVPETLQFEKMTSADVKEQSNVLAELNEVLIVTSFVYDGKRGRTKEYLESRDYEIIFNKHFKGVASDMIEHLKMTIIKKIEKEKNTLKVEDNE